MDEKKLERQKKRECFINAVDLIMSTYPGENFTTIGESLGKNGAVKIHNIKRGLSTPSDTEAINLIKKYPDKTVTQLLSKKFIVNGVGECCEEIQDLQSAIIMAENRIKELGRHIDLLEKQKGQLISHIPATLPRDIKKAINLIQNKIKFKL